MKTLAILNTIAPHGSGVAIESLDLALAAGSFGQNVRLYFMDNGVYQLLNAQRTDAIEARNISKTFAALEFYDIEEIFVCNTSLQIRGLKQEDLCIDVTLLNEADMNVHIQQADTILRF
ncbi:sulfurtransferase complex subunit TusC [Aestuariibacter sp. AA17]|uniref:Sulfurtransferase complex subunit TusC n=1 Tax=Fluctibacter corallii TaxID=2984329 RepID=A0ABT3A5W9_9ALTE|nr:sulfurtransferase complex subunit TusC [Aestuariibacter sp. AA17]MCV2884082.1 sulfurtransferase complex subunit TusC [Aestuariibacter sp. AA17]